MRTEDSGSRGTSYTADIISTMGTEIVRIQSVSITIFTVGGLPKASSPAIFVFDTYVIVTVMVTLNVMTLMI